MNIDSFMFPLVIEFCILLICLLILNTTQHYVVRHLPANRYRFLFYIFALPGVVVHELGHLALVLLSPNNKLADFSLFSPDLESGRLGYVNHTYTRNFAAPFINMLIGLAPLCSGMLALYLIHSLIFPDDIKVFELFEYLLNNASSTIYIGLFLSSSIMCFMMPSKSDFLGAGKGIILSLLFFLLICYFNPSVLESRFVSQLIAPALAFITPASLCLFLAALLAKVLDTVRVK